MPRIIRLEHIVEEYDWLLLPDYAYFDGWHEFRRFSAARWETKVGPEWLEINGAEALGELEAIYQHYQMAQAVKEVFCDAPHTD